MADWVDKTIERMIPADWPLFWRRAFLLTIPVSGPIWLLFTSLFLLVFYIPQAAWEDFGPTIKRLWTDHA